MAEGRWDTGEARPASRPVLVCIPSSDRAFCEEVRKLAASVPTLTPSTLAYALHATYPAVHVRPSELSDTTLVAWYVYRDGHFPWRDSP